MSETVLFDRYRLLDPAGSGGSAEVWRALDLQTGQEVAVKRLHPVVFADEAARRRLRREFDALGALDEPHIVRVRDLQIGDREAILVLDYVAGPSLAGLLASQTPRQPAVGPATAVDIVSDVASALSAAHAAGIVHRDVTPGNILRAPDGSARLTDFGIAMTADSTAVTATGLLMGTMRYLAPEQLRGEPATPASDLHALAAVAYELLAGRPAYEATSPVALADEQRTGPPAIAGVPAAVDAAVRSGLAPDPADRPPDVHAFAATVTGAFASDATVPIRLAAVPRAAPVAAVSAAGKVGRRIPAPAVALAAALLAVGLVAAIGSTDRRPPAGVSASSAPRAVPAATVRPTASPRATPVAREKPKKGHGHGDGHDHGNGDEGGD